MRRTCNTSFYLPNTNTPPLTSAMVADFPQEIIDTIIDEFALDQCGDARDQVRAIKQLSLVSSKWLHRSRMYLFHALEFTPNSFSMWCRDVRPGVGGPSRHVAYIRYKPSSLGVGRGMGLLDGLARNPLHTSAFTNLRTLHLVDMSLQHTSCLTYFGGLTAVRELWLEDCQMDINQFVSFVRSFPNIEHLRLMRPQCAHEIRLQHPDPPPLKGTLEFHQPVVATSVNIATFIDGLSLVPSYFSTIVFRERLDIPEAVNKLLAASRRTLTKLTFGHNSKAYSVVEIVTASSPTPRLHF